MVTTATIKDVVDQHLCMGCGTCAAARPDIVTMVDTVAHGRRPVIASDLDESASRDLAASCPGRAIDAVEAPTSDSQDSYEHTAWGPVLEVWEGYATDEALRFSGSSGGVVSALSLFCVEAKDYAGAIQVRAREEQPLLNETVISRSRSDVLAATASRYAPASPCERLADIRGSDTPHVFVGKPCDVAGANRLAAQDDSVKNSVGLSISIFCAGTPSLAATNELLEHLGVEQEDQVLDVRYRGQGWPGRMTARYRSASTGETLSASTSYADGWGRILQKHTQWRCRLCADHLGDHADLSIGDPWYRPVAEGDPGQSLIVVRTERGRQILRQAMRAGVVNLEPRTVATLAASQPNLERTKGAVFARCLTAKVMGAAAPQYAGSTLHRVWWRALSPVEKLKSVTGTLKRLFGKGLLRREQAQLLERQS
ncbi:MAG: Coenzyme F420 hydrogenase/dehydrogenase, beta subunit C-terminal domain [Halieaceae bacterium]